MNNWLRIWPAVLLLISLAASPAFAQGKIGTIDLRKVFDGYWKTKQADSALKDRAADMEKEHKNMLEDWRNAKKDYEGLLSSANDQNTTPEERDRRKRTAEDKLVYIKETEETITKYERQARTTLDEQRKRMRDNILGEIRNVLNAKAKTAGYSLVVDTAAESINNTPMVLYTNNENDMTQAILTELNATAPADLPKVDEKKSEEKKADEKKSEKKKSP